MGQSQLPKYIKQYKRCSRFVGVLGLLEKYKNGDYVLGKLNKDGQRLSIKIEIARKDNGNKVSFITGWMVYPNGHIQLTTPYGGK